MIVLEPVQLTASGRPVLQPGEVEHLLLDKVRELLACMLHVMMCSSPQCVLFSWQVLCYMSMLLHCLTRKDYLQLHKDFKRLTSGISPHR